MSAAPGLGRRLASNTLHAATGRGVAMVVWLLLTPPILATLGPEGFAVWSLLFALTGYFGALDFGLAQGTLQSVAAARARNDPASGGAYATLAALGYGGLGLLWLAITLALRGPIMDWLRVPDAVRGAAGFAILASAGIFTLSGLANIGMAVLQASGRFDLANRVLLVVTIQQAIGIPVVLAMHWGLRGLVLNVGLGWMLGLALGLWLLRGAVPEFRWRNPRLALGHAREVVRFGGPMQICNALSVIHTHLDKFLLARLVALAAVTPYELGFRVAIAANGVPQLLLLAVLPAAAAIHAGDDPGRLRDLYQRANRYVLAAGAITLAVLIGCADRLFWIWLGPGHAESALALRGIAVAGGITIATGMGTTLARGIARTDLEAWFAGVALVTHVVLSLWLMPAYGIAGALVAIVVSNLVGAALFMTLLARTLKWPVMRALFEPCGIPLASAAVGAAAALALDRALPSARGALGWALLGVPVVVAGGLSLAVLLVTRFVHIGELRGLLVSRAGDVPPRS